MNVKTQQKAFLGAIALVVVPASVAATWSLVRASSPQASTALVAQLRPNSEKQQQMERQQIVKAIQLDDRKNGGSASAAPIRVDKIAVDGPYALASVLIGEEGGGVAVLSKKQSTWQVIGGGGGWVVRSDLEALGIPRRKAQSLLGRLDPNWQSYELPQ